jgi:hypothetical protein
MIKLANSLASLCAQRERENKNKVCTTRTGERGNTPVSRPESHLHIHLLPASSRAMTNNSEDQTDSTIRQSPISDPVVRVAINAPAGLPGKAKNPPKAAG